MTWYDQRDEDFESKILLEAKFILSSIGAKEVIIQGKDSWGVDVILFDWHNMSHELMLVLYEGPGKSEVILNNLVTGKTIHFNDELNLSSKLTRVALLNLE